MPNRKHTVRRVVHQPPRPTKGDSEAKDQFHISLPIERLRERMAAAVEHARARKPYPLRAWEHDWSNDSGRKYR